MMKDDTSCEHHGVVIIWIIQNVYNVNCLREMATSREADSHFASS